MFLHNAWQTLLELAPWLLFGMLAAGLLHGLLPPGFVSRTLRGRGGVLRAVALGVPLPLCSCGVIPTGVGLRRDGASPGATLGFLVSTPQTGVDSILVSASMLGWPFALFKVGSAFVTGLLGGWLADAVLPEEPDASAAGHGPAGRRPGWRQMVAHGVEILESFWHWLVFGVLVSAAITTWLPPDVFARELPLGAVGGVLAALLVSLPLYVCATASVPIAAALVASGFPPGAALVFLMAGPATNLATMGAVRQALGTRALVIYLATIILGSVGFGVAFDFLLGASSTAAVAHMHTGAWQVPFAVLLLALVAFVGARDLRNRWSSRRASSDGGSADSTVIGVDGMTCHGCANRVAAAIRNEDGVEAVQIQLEEKRAVVTGAIDIERLRQIIRDAGYEPRE